MLYTKEHYREITRESIDRIDAHLKRIEHCKREIAQLEIDIAFAEHMIETAELEARKIEPATWTLTDGNPLTGALEFDYDNQAWLHDGYYIPCNHPAEMNCQCFGKIHAGEAKR